MNDKELLEVGNASAGESGQNQPKALGGAFRSSPARGSGR